MFLNVERKDAAAVSFAMHLVYFAPALIFGIYYFLHGDMSVARFRSLLSSEHAEEEILDERPEIQPSAVNKQTDQMTDNELT